MVVGAPAARPARSARPVRPRRSLLGPLGIVCFLVLTAISLSDQYGIGFDLGSLIADLGRGRAIIAQLLSPNWSYLPQTIGPMIETFQIAVVSAVLGCGLALPIAFLVSRVTTPGRVTYVVVRSVLNVIRAIPDVLYALIFVAAAGVGPLPGVAALLLFNIGVMAKLLSETVDDVDRGPIEAARASGGNRVQTIRWAVYPQVLPNYVAYALYTFELNIRASTVLGIVGAGGIGRTLLAQYKLFHWSNVSVIIIELFVFVLAIEMISIAVRRRLS
jgi:phosphonate transport system permease protein